MAHHNMYAKVIGTNSILGTVYAAKNMPRSMVGFPISTNDHVTIRTEKVVADYEAIQLDILSALEYFELASLEIVSMKGEVLHCKNNPDAIVR